MNWTQEQKAVISAHNRNLLVSAAAGSGKTAVLVERIVQLLINEKADITKFLIVTFTHAAAGEMRERISSALLAEMEKGNSNQEHLRKQINLLSRASISTLHAFCTNVIRKYFFLVEIDPHFRIGNAAETGLMKAEVLEELFENEYAKDNGLFCGLVEMFGSSKNDKPFQDLVLHCYHFIQGQPYPQKWLREKIEEFAVDIRGFEESLWVKTLMNHVKMRLMAARGLFFEARIISEKPGGPRNYKNCLLDDISTADNLITAADKGLAIFSGEVKGIVFKRLGRVAKDVDERLKAEAKELRNEGKNIIQKIQNSIAARPPGEYSRELNEIYPYMKYFNELVITFIKNYQERKKEKAILDFNDLEHYTIKILSNKIAAGEYQKQYEYIFVDEYQDSNLVQESILNYLKKENNIFLVGDVKQSIYRFRLADPSLFLEKSEAFQSGEETINRKINLNTNFRSREEIIHAVNCIFKHIMSRELGEIDYDEKVYLNPNTGREEPAITETQEINFGKNQPVEVCLIEKDLAGESVNEIIRSPNIEIEAEFIVQRINDLTSKKIYDTELKEYRNIVYRDIVILLRTTQNWSGVFLEKFLAAGIPAYADVNTGYFDTVEMAIFINLLRLIDNKRQDIPLLSVMRSSIGGFNTDDLIKIRVNYQSKGFFEAVEKYIDQNDDRLAKRIKTFITQLNLWKDESRFIPLDEFIWKLLTETGYYYYTGALPGGQQRQANLRILYERARQFQQTSIKGLFNFIKFVDKLKTSNGDMGTARILGENDNVVRIMSVHKSKGLEFPVVIIAGMGKHFNLTDTTARVLFHKDLGIGPRYVNLQLRSYRDTIARMAVKNKIRLESLSEEMRILYVAMTRAKEKLVMVGSVADLKEKANKWKRNIIPFNLAQGRTFLDWIGPVLMRHIDGEELRELSSISWEKDKLIKEKSRWSIKICKQEQVVQQAIKKIELQKDFKGLLEDFPCQGITAEKDIISSRLNWKYSKMEAVKIPSKISVTQVKNLKSGDLDRVGIIIPGLIKRPKFIITASDPGKTEFTAVEKGAIIHLVMQHLDFSQVGNEKLIQEQVNIMVKKELLRQEEAAAADCQKIFKFFCSQLGQRILKAKEVYRESPFNLLIKAFEVIEEIEDDEEELLIQGVVDLYFREENELVLVDYKTDFISSTDRDIVIDRYRVQLELYKTALERIQGQRVKESYLYLFAIDEEILI